MAVDRGAGGAANWRGSEHERGAAAYLATHCLCEEAVRALGPEAASVPLSLRLQADEPIDDIVCQLSGGGTAYLQARRTLDLRRRKATGLAWVASQWVEQAKAGGLDPDHDRLVAVAHRLSESVERIAAALLTLQSKGETDLRPSEKEALATVEKMLGDATAEQRAAILSCARIWILQASDELDNAQNQCRQLLGSRIVPEAHRGAALNRLLNVCASGARLRRGYDREGLLDELRREDIPLRNDEPGSPGAERGALVRYRDRIERRGSTLDFAGLGASIPPLSLEIADAEVRVSPGGPNGVEDDRFGIELTWGMRRRGQVLLTGLPGGGKTTALRVAAAEYARRSEWPLPIVVRVDRLARRLEEGGLREGLVEIAAEGASGTDRAVLRRILDAALDGGQVALFFDALDEAGAARHQALRAIGEFLSELNPVVEVLIATRDLAYADAAGLGFFELRLLAPREPTETVDAVLATLAERDVPEADRNDWIKERSGWVSKWIWRDPALKETPLVPVLLAMLAASRNTESRPGTLAGVMIAIVEAVVEQWEARRDSARVGSLRRSVARRALVEAFLVLSRAVLGEQLPPLRHCREAVATRLGAELGLSALEAEASAEDACAFWDEAGFFVIDSDDRVRARLRLFAELGEGWRASRLDPDAAARWAANAVASADLLQSLRLAVQISPSIGAEAIRSVTAEAEPDGVLRVAEATDGAARLAVVDRDLLAAALLMVLETSTEHRRKAAEHLVTMRLPRSIRKKVSAALVALPADQRPAFEAYLALGAEHPSEEENRAIRRVIDAPPPREEAEEGNSDVFFTLRGGDMIWASAVTRAFEIHLPNEPALIERGLALLSENGGMWGRDLETVLRKHGDDGTRAEFDRRAGLDETVEHVSRATDLLASIDQRRQFDLELLGWLAELTEPSSMTQRERRRLDLLVDLWTSLEMSTVGAFVPSQTAAVHEALVKEALIVLAELAVPDLALLAAEAQSFLGEFDRFPDDRSGLFSLLNMAGRDLHFDGWSRLTEPERAKGILFRGMKIGRWLSWLSIRAIAAGPPSPTDLATVRSMLPDLQGTRRYNAGRLLLSVERVAAVASWLEDEDPILRNAAAWRIAVETEKPTHELLMAALADRDEEVRANLLRSSRSPAASELLELLAEVDLELRPWLCIRCENVNHSNPGSCENCHRVGGDFHRLRDDLLAGIES